MGQQKDMTIWPAETIVSAALSEIRIGPKAPTETPVPFAPAKRRVSGSLSVGGGGLANTRPGPLELISGLWMIG
jgi:hypothetical protein